MSHINQVPKYWYICGIKRGYMSHITVLVFSILSTYMLSCTYMLNICITKHICRQYEKYQNGYVWNICSFYAAYISNTWKLGLYVTYKLVSMPHITYLLFFILSTYMLVCIYMLNICITICSMYVYHVKKLTFITHICQMLSHICKIYPAYN